jgi:glutamyl/glutaminyl-tRNA synthetase
MYNTRIAPSPTGDLHIGTARTAYFNWLAARSTGGKFILRIDDTDQKRNNPEYTKVILDTMDWLGLDYDEIIYQSNRFDIYRGYAAWLVQQGWANIQDGAIILNLRLDTKLNWPDHWMDEIGGKILITADDLNCADKMVLIKSDGSPSYNFCSVIDDLELNINFVIRGVDHITNTSRQVILYSLLEDVFTTISKNDLPKYAHLGLICVKNKPMSKRDGDSSMLRYINAGFDPDAMLNFLGRLGWGPTVDDKTTTLLPRERMLELFLNHGKMKNRNAEFDMRKLESFDRKYKAKKNLH